MPVIVHNRYKRNQTSVTTSFEVTLSGFRAVQGTLGSLAEGDVVAPDYSINNTLHSEPLKTLTTEWKVGATTVSTNPYLGICDDVLGEAVTCELTAEDMAGNTTTLVTDTLDLTGLSKTTNNHPYMHQNASFLNYVAIGYHDSEEIRPLYDSTSTEIWTVWDDLGRDVGFTGADETNFWTYTSGVLNGDNGAVNLNAPIATAGNNFQHYWLVNPPSQNSTVKDGNGGRTITTVTSGSGSFRINGSEWGDASYDATGWNVVRLRTNSATINGGTNGTTVSQINVFPRSGGNNNLSCSLIAQAITFTWTGSGSFDVSGTVSNTSNYIKWVSTPIRCIMLYSNETNPNDAVTGTNVTINDIRTYMVSTL